MLLRTHSLLTGTELRRASHSFCTYCRLAAMVASCDFSRGCQKQPTGSLAAKGEILLRSGRLQPASPCVCACHSADQGVVCPGLGEVRAVPQSLPWMVMVVVVVVGNEEHGWWAGVAAYRAPVRVTRQTIGAVLPAAGCRSPAAGLPCWPASLSFCVAERCCLSACPRAQTSR